MLKKSLTIFFILMVSLVGALYAQSKYVDTIIDNYCRKCEDKTLLQLHLPNFIELKGYKYWRFWYDGDMTSYIIDIYYKNDQSLYNGSITFYTYENIEDSDEKPTNRIYSQKIEIEKSKVLKIFNLIQNRKISSIPTDKKIAGWNHGFDGVTYFVEYSDDNNYSLKNYWTPEDVKIKEAAILNSFFKSINKTLDIEKLNDSFEKSIPFENYNTGGPHVNYRPLSLQQKQAYKKERDEYRNTHEIN